MPVGLPAWLFHFLGFETSRARRQTAVRREAASRTYGTRREALAEVARHHQHMTRKTKHRR